VNGDESYKDGIHAEELIKIGKLLERYGVAAIEVSCGIDWKEMGPAKGKVPVDMILNQYPGIKELPSPVKRIARPFVLKMMKDTETGQKNNVPAARKLKENVQIPIIAVGGIRDLADVESTIQEDGIDFVSMSRALILEPGLVNKFKDGKSISAKCLSCNDCLIG
ncbi:MAG: tRNA-dihydrouridine synthase, partial [Eubacteriales bacterium]|nr:tRNA-dihydrouridine synthase [Eubacteriales bacterium]